MARGPVDSNDMDKVTILPEVELQIRHMHLIFFLFRVNPHTPESSYPQLEPIF